MIRRPLRCAALCALALVVTVLQSPVTSAVTSAVTSPLTSSVMSPATSAHAQPRSRADLPASTVPGARMLPAARKGTADSAPRVSIQHLQPTSLRVGRPIELSGVVRNTTDEDWSEVQVSMVISESPVSSPGNLAEARADRGALALRQVLAPGDFQDLGDVAPGTESSFTLQNTWDQLPITRASGAYVIGVEVRAFLEDGLRSAVAETTTFVPLVAPEAAADPVDLAMLWPLTVGVALAESGYVEPTLARQFSGNGRLSALTELGASAGDFPLTWVVDPAVLDAARDMSDGFEIAGGDSVPADDERAIAAESWLSSTLSTLDTADVLTLPYADPDVASLAHGGLARALTPAAEAATSTLEDLEVSQRTVLWPAKGWIDRHTLRAASRIAPTLTLVADDSVRGTGGQTVVPLGTDGTNTGVTYPRRAVSPRGGETTLQWRQQLLAATAVRALGGGGPMVVVPPRTLALGADWADADFFDGLQGSWLRARPLSELTDDPAGRPPRLRYPRVARRSELPPENLNALRDLIQARDTLLGVLADPDASGQRLDKAIGIGASVHWRDEPELGESLARSYIDSIRGRLDQIVVEAPSFITLSGDEGPFPVTVSNGLDDQAITVSVEVDASDNALQIQPIEQVTIAPQQRRSIPVQANYTGVGISNVTVRMLDADGDTFGDPVVVRVRTTQIGEVVWVVMAIGGIIIFGAAIRSVIRRIRRRGSPPSDPSSGSGA